MTECNFMKSVKLFVSYKNILQRATVGVKSSQEEEYVVRHRNIFGRWCRNLFVWSAYKFAWLFYLFVL